MSRLEVLVAVGLVLCTACAAFECGAPLALCGRDVPKDAKCDKGNGWCQTGHHCHSEKGQSKCLPVPKDCGKAGNVCCPSNTDNPHTASQAFERAPFCRDGSTCFYNSLDATFAYTPEYAGVPGQACVAVPKDCGEKAGSICCPNLYRTSTEPALKKAQCPADTFCESDKENGPKYPGSNLLGTATGLCVANVPDCGKLGKRCCVSQGLATVAYGCNPENGKKGYCVSASGKNEDLICTQCPDSLPAGFKYASDCKA